ncbi:monovalent cation/H(+) antiporter subunit G [Rubrobacter indicoceani]|uniref:monovalent cation/H(+) antiporter subunit G n=1 Tax=Rubrobacter indicoceani TaxID=2051957 RepID=UPI000E5BA929|nr:monovalent cation/H(+) antiporter subunit G [Rubrobacter indicoceani]
METFISLLDDALVVLGLVIMTIGVYGVVRFPDVYTRLHAASKAVFLGVIVFLAASCLTGGPPVILRSVLIGLFLLVTTPVAAHLVAQSAFARRVSMRTPGAVDESGSGLPLSGKDRDTR